MASAERGHGAGSRGLEAALVFAVLVLLFPFLLILFAVKLSRMAFGWRDPSTAERGYSATWGLFVST